MSLCNQCKECQDYYYHRTLRNGRNISFKYCRGTKMIVDKYKWVVRKRKHTEIYTTTRIDGSFKSISYFIPKKKGDIVSPIDGDITNFKLSNLEILSKAELIQKNSSNNPGSSIFPGVYKKKWTCRDGSITLRWAVNMKYQGTDHYLGCFDDEYKAAHAYYEECKKIGRDINKDTDAYKKYQEELAKRELSLPKQPFPKVEDNEIFDDFVFRRKLTKPRSIYKYRRALTLFQDFVGKPLDEIIAEAKKDYLEKVFPDDGSVFKYITSFHNYLFEKGYSGPSRSSILSAVKVFYKSFFIPIPFGVGYEKEYRRKMVLEDIITIKEIKKLFLYSNLRFRPVLLSLFSTGLRVNDVLKWSCGDFVEFMKNYSNKKDIKEMVNDLKDLINDNVLVGTVHNIALKNEKSHYTYLNPQAVKWIVLSLLNRDDLSNDAPLFLNKAGNQLKYKNAELEMVETREKSGLTELLENSVIHRVHFHAFRRAFATTLAPHIDYFRLENLMGHEHGSSHGMYVAQNKEDDKKLYKSVMHHLMFNEDQCFKCDFCKFHNEEKGIFCEKSRSLLEEDFNLDNLRFLEKSRIEFINGNSQDLRLINIVEVPI